MVSGGCGCGSVSDYGNGGGESGDDVGSVSSISGNGGIVVMAALW